MKRCLLVVSAVVMLGAMQAFAAEEGGVPFPLHTIEGTGGVILVPTAYLANPAAEGAVGLPAFGAYFANLDHKNLSTFSITETLWSRVELGYAYNNLQLGELEDIMPAIDTSHVVMHNFNVRALLVAENALDTSWIPAITAGVHYKRNEDIDAIDKRLAGALDGLGVKDDDGVDFTLVGTKTIASGLGRPVILSIGGRATEASHLGLFGFVDHYKVMLETSVVCLLTGNLALAAEYRMKPDELEQLPGVVESEDNWWDVGLAYIVNEHLSVAAGYVQYGEVLDEKVNGGWIANVKWEF